jgi:hypothetical protein
MNLLLRFVLLWWRAMRAELEGEDARDAKTAT